MDPRIQVIIWLAVLIVAALFIAVIGLIIHRRYTRSDGLEGTAFTLDDLRRLHRSGQLTDEEFARAKAVLIAQATDASAPEAPPPNQPPPTNPDGPEPPTDGADNPPGDPPTDAP